MQLLAQGFTDKKLGDHVRRAVVFAKIMYRQDVRVIQRSRSLRLLLKAPEPLRIARKGRRQDLDGNLAIEPRVARAIHLAHAAGSSGRNNLVWSKLGACG